MAEHGKIYKSTRLNVTSTLLWKSQHFYAYGIFFPIRLRWK